MNRSGTTSTLHPYPTLGRSHQRIPNWNQKSRWAFRKRIFLGSLQVAPLLSLLASRAIFWVHNRLSMRWLRSIVRWIQVTDREGARRRGESRNWAKVCLTWTSARRGIYTRKCFSITIGLPSGSPTCLASVRMKSYYFIRWYILDLYVESCSSFGARSDKLFIPIDVLKCSDIFRYISIYWDIFIYAKIYSDIFRYN